MEKVISTEKKPIKLWLNDIEEGAMTQLKNLANFPDIYKWICAMPDCHRGYGMPIGGILATKDIIIPNAVGVDIGCGMCAVKTSLTEINIDTLKKIMEEIRKAIPVGKNHHKKEQDDRLFPKLMPDHKNLIGSDMIVSQQFNSALKQIGTLGSGNHFIEIQKDNNGYIWIMIHSGSRNIGFKVANHYNKLAIELNKKWLSSIPKEHELAFLPTQSDEGKAYLKEMNYCIKFALANRKLMMNRVIDCFNLVLNKYDKMWHYPENAFIDNEERHQMINIAHNYVTLENHFGQNVWIHRKGATLARKGTIGIIPGSQGTKSYIVEGLGNPDSFMSCSHGAGRKMGRKQAIRELDLKKQQKLLTGILHSVQNKEKLDESPGAYKDINEVMNNQKDLVKILVELTPLAVIKG